MRETRGVETRTLPVELTDDELLQRGDELARAIQAVREEERHQKAQREAMKDALASLQGDCARLAQVVRERAEPRSVGCRIVHDYAANAVQLVREDTGEVIESRAMSDHERQLGLQ